MYHFYHTEGWVVAKRLRGEHDVVVSILTTDKALGLVRARVTSGAASHSRMRFALEPLSEGHYTFVRGKTTWRLIGAVSRAWHAPTIVRSPLASAVGGLLLLIEELIPGEGELPAEVWRLLARAVKTECASCRSRLCHPQVMLMEWAGELARALGYLPPHIDTPSPDALASVLARAGARRGVYYLHAT